MDVDRCVVCGAPVPEGRMVCWQCEHRNKEENKEDSDGREQKATPL